MKMRSDDDIKVLVVDDDSHIRALLRQVVENSGSSVVGEAENGKQAIARSEELHPDIALLDVSMPAMSGFLCARCLHQSMPELNLIFVSQHRDRSYLDEAIECGAKGYVVKSAAVNELPLAMRAVEQGGTFYSSLVK